MSRHRGWHPTAAALLAVAAGCATARGVAALRELEVEPDRVTGVRVAGVSLDQVRSLDDLSPAAVATVVAGVALGRAPLSFDVVLRASNPPTNRVPAELLRMDWWLLLDGRDAVAGRVDRRHTIAPGATVEVPVRVAFDAADLIGRHAGTLLRLGLALAGESESPLDIRLRVQPIVDTPLGGLRMPAVTIPLDRLAG